MLLHIDDFSLDFQTPSGQWRQVLHRVSLAVEPGRTHALVGESGSGKTVTALSVLRLLEHSARVRYRGGIHFDGQEITAMEPEALRRVRGNRIAMIFQEPMTSLNPVYTVGRQLMEPLLIHQGLERAEARRRAASLLERTGIDQPERRLKSYPFELSGGQRQRVMIAMALACRPDLLIADEPTTALDVTIQAQILDLIRDVQQEFGMAVLLISHDLPLVGRIAEEVSIMYQGRVVEQGACADIFARPSHAYTRRLMEAVPASRRTVPAHSSAREERVLMVRGLCRTFRSGRGSLFPWAARQQEVRAVDRVDLDLDAGATLGVVGESGSGKTTLGMSLLRLTPADGEIVYVDRQGNSHRLDCLSPRAMRPLRREIQLVFQDPFSSLSPRLSIGRIVAEGLDVHEPGLDRRERERRVARALEEVELDPGLRHRYPHEFSGGQRQRIAIARAMILRPRLLILDEPTSALDVTTQGRIIELLLDLQQRHAMGYIFISHDLRVVRALADHILVMRHGQVVEAGPAARLFARPRDPYTRELFAAAFLSSTEKGDAAPAA